jgi:SAM-dependent methyltransferase
VAKVEPEDVPSAIDFHDPAHARRWTEETPGKRPWRVSFFAEFCTALSGPQLRILELGSGPGHLAREILTRCDVVEYVALDFSSAMHDLAREHLGELASRVTFVTRDFRAPAWIAGLSGFDAVVTMQAVHEARHKRRALPLLAQARAILRPGGQLLYCDHYFAEGHKPGLMLDRFEQPAVLRAAGYANVRLLRDEGGMALYAAT